MDDSDERRVPLLRDPDAYRHHLNDHGCFCQGYEFCRICDPAAPSHGASVPKPKPPEQTAWSRVLQAMNENQVPDALDVQAVKDRCDQLYKKHPVDHAALRAACFGLIVSGEKA